jgi:NarL family two-component system response regulator YdfI
VIRLLIADDHPVVREGLRALLETAPDITLVGEAGDGAEAVRLAAELSPDLILMDLRMPGVGGIEAIQQIKARDPSVEIVILTTYDDDDQVLAGLHAGARGYLLKDVDRDVLFESLRSAHRGETLLQASVARTLVAHLETPRSARTEGLTPRELEVLALMAAGAANKQIAERLDIAERTVKAHATSIFNRLGVDSRTEAVAVALRRGLLPPAP